MSAALMDDPPLGVAFEGVDPFDGVDDCEPLPAAVIIALTAFSDLADGPAHPAQKRRATAHPSAADPCGLNADHSIISSVYLNYYQDALAREMNFLIFFSPFQAI